MLYFFIWLSGAIGVYIVEKRFVTRKYKTWKRKNRTQAILMSVLSWPLLLIAFTGMAVEKLCEALSSETPASW